MNPILSYFLQNIFVFALVLILASWYTIYTLSNLTAGNKPSSAASQSDIIGFKDENPVPWIFSLMAVGILVFIWVALVFLMPDVLFSGIYNLLHWIFSQI